MKSYACLTFFLLVLVACASSKKNHTAADTIDRDGSSIEKAIIVNTADEEQAWIKEHYPESTVANQTVTFKSKKPFHKVDVQLSDGAQTIVYFDIGKFYKGK